MATNYDDVIAKHRKYLTHAQISALAKASEEYGLLNAGKRAEALLSAREQFDAGQRGLQNMGLSGAADAPATSGEVPRLVQKIQTPYDQYNRRLQDVENRQLASLGAAFAANTKRAMDEARKKREEELANRHAPAEYEKPQQWEEHRINATDRGLLDHRQEMKEPAATPKVSTDDGFIGPPTKEQWMEQQERKKRYFSALAAAKATGIPIPDLTGEMKSAKVESEVKSDIVKQATDPTARRLPPTLGMDPTRRAGIREAQSVVDKLTADKSAGKPVSDSEYKKALADVDIAKLTAENPWMAELFEDPGTAEKGYTNVSEPGALGGGSSYYDGLKSAAAAETEKNTAKKKEIDAALKNQREQYQHYKSLLDVIDSDGGYKEDKDRALASIKASPLTVDQARQFVSKYEELQRWAPETTANDSLYYADPQRNDPDAYKALQVYPYLSQIKERYPDLASWVEGKVADYNMQQHGFRMPTMSAEKYEENKANIKGIKSALKAVQNAQYEYDNAGAPEADDVVSDKDHAAAALAEAKAALKNKYGMSVQDAERFIEAFERERDVRSEYNYYRPGMVAQLEHSGEKPTKPVNQRESDGVYRLVNGLVTNPNTHSFGGIDVSAHEYISKDQRDAYNAIYERNGIEAANEFYKSIIPYLNIQRAAADESSYKKKADEHPFWADLRSIGANLVWNVPASVENISKGIQGRFTEERPYYDMNSSASFRSRRADIIRTERSQNILSNMERPDLANKALNFAYNTGMSIGDSAAVMALAYLGAPPAVTSVVFGSSAGNQAYKDAMERGATQDQALSYAIVNGVAEALFEEVSLEKVMTMDFTGRGALIKNLLSQSFVEGSEELATGVADLLGDLWVMQDKSQYNLAKKQYIAQGMTEYQAESRAFLDQVKDVNMDALGGFISGAAFAGGGAVLSSAQYKAAGKKLRAGKSATMDRYTRAAQILGGKSLDALQQYQAEQTDTNAGKLKAAVDDTFRDLFGNGEDIPDVSNASSIANAKQNPLRTDAALDVDAAKNERVIDRATAGAAMLSGDRMNTTLAKTIMDVLGDGYLRDQGYDVSSPQAFSNDYNARLDKYGIKPYAEVQTAATPKLSPQAGTLADARLRKADQAFRAESPSSEGGILAGKALQQRQQNRQQVDMKAKENAAANRVWKNPNQGYTTTADGKQVMSLPGNMTAVARAEYERKNFKAQTTAKMDGVTLELSGMEARKGLTDAQIFAEAKKAMTKDAAQKLDVYMKLSKALSLPMVIRDVVAGTSGYVHDGTLYVTLSGQQSIPRVVAHELTHFMQQHASEKYDALRTHLVTDVGGKTEFEKLMREKAERYGLDLSNEAERNEADDEVCAELCERMLSNTEALERFAEKNVGAATTLRDRLLKILNVVKAALKDVKNRDFGNSKSDLITQEETIEAWYDGISDAIRSASEHKATEAKKETTTEAETKEETTTREADELFMTENDTSRAELRKSVEATAEKGAYVRGYTAGEVDSVLEAGILGDRPNYEANDYENARAMIAQLIPDIVSAAKGEADAFDVFDRVKEAVSIMYDNYFEDSGDMTALREAIPSVIGVDSTAKGDLKHQDMSLFQMSAKLSKALGKKVTLIGETNAKGQKNASFRTVEKLEEVWERVRDQFGLSEGQDFSIDTTKLLDFIQQQTDTRKTAEDLFGSSLQDEVNATAGNIVEAVADMLSKKTGQRYSLDTDALRGQQENRVRYMVDTTIGEGLLEPISDQRFQQLSAKNDNTYLVTNRTDLEKHVRSALTGDKKANIEIGVLPRDAAIKINEDIPNLPASFNGMLLRPYLQYAVEVSYDSMRHLRNEHGFTENEVVDYVLRIPDVLRNHDSVHFSWFEMHDGRQAGIRFKSSIPNGFNVVYELVSKKRNVLQLKTDYEKVIGPVYPAKSQMRSGVTSETASILALSDSLADSQKKSNTPAEHSLDEEYLDLAEKYKSGTATKAETEQLRKAVDQAARKAGYTTKAYHGTTADFTKFDKSKIGSATDEGVYGRGFYFSTSRQQSEQYSKGKAPMEVFLNTGNQLLLNDHSSVEELADLLNMSESNLTQDRSTGVVRPLYSQVNQFAAHVQEAGYDSVRADYGASDEIVMFDSDRIKSADPVTYDDKGNIIPLSERFNAKSDDIRYIIDEDAIRQAFTVIDTAGIEDGLEALKDVKHVGAFALKDISRFLDASAGKNKDLRNMLHAIFEAPHSEATGRYARGVERMQQKVLDIGQRAGVCDAKGKHFDSKKSAAIQNIGERFSNTYTDLKLKEKDAEHVTVQAFDPGTDKMVVPEKDYTLKELRQAYGANAADYVWDQVFHQAEDAQATGGEKGWVEQKVNTRPYTLTDLQAAFPNDWQQLKAAADEFRQMYDEYIRDQNNMLATIYPIESEYADVEKLETAIAKKEERLTRHKDAVAQQIDSLQKSLEAKEKEMAGKKRTDTKAYRQLYEQASKMTDKIAELKSEIAEYEANIRDELVKMNTLKAEMQNAGQKGDYSLKRMHRLQYRSDYFHHFSEMVSGIENLKSIFTNNTDIAPAIVGKSEGTKAKTKWAGYFQQRMGGDYTADALNGMLRYGQLAEYKLAFDPLTAYLRDVNKQIRDLSSDTNRDGLIRYIDQWADNIDGKSHKIDRVVSDAGMAPRKAMQILQWINSRVIQNTLLFNMRSALVQISNITNAKGIVKNNIDWANGLRSWAMAARGDEAMASIMSQSNFLASRYMDGLELTDSKLKSVKQFAGWMLGALDEISAKATWWAAYQQYTRNPHAADNQYRSYDSAVDYADDVTRRTHAGRGVGELAPAMTSKVVNFVAPFQVEVNNTWALLKDNVKQKNFLGLLSTGLSVFLFNTAFEAIVGSTPLGFDFIRAILDIVLGFTNDDDDDDPTVKSIAQRFAGELVGGLPFGGQLVTAIGKERAKKLLGNNTDVTRYDNTQIGVTSVWNAAEGLLDIGSGLVDGRRVNWIDDLDDLLNLTMPFGGKQLTRTAQGIATVAKGYAGKYDKNGEEKVQFVTDGTILKYIHAGLFGKWALTEASEYFGEKRLLPQLFGKYNGPKSSLGSMVDAKEYKAALATGIDGKCYFTLKSDLNGYSTQAGKRAELMQKDLTPEQKAKLDALMIVDKKKASKTEGGVVYQQNSDGDWEVKADYTNQDMFDLSTQGNKTYTNTVDAMEKTGLPQDQAALAADMWDRAKDADDRKAAFRDMLRDNYNLTVAQKEALNLQYTGNKYPADYSDPELYELSVKNRATYEKAKQAKEQGIPVKQCVGLYDKKNAYSGEDKADYMRKEIMNSNLSVKQKELLDDLLVSDKGRNPDYSSPAWFEISMLGGGQYEEAKQGEKVGLKPETYLTVYKKWKSIDAKDKNGKTVSGLKKKRAKEYLDSLPISAPVYDYIWTAVFGYKTRK